MYTRPTGLCGLQNKKTFVSGRTAASKASKSMRQPPAVASSYASDTIINSFCASACTLRKGGYTGVNVSTESPAPPTARHAIDFAGTNPGNHSIHDASASTP